MAETPFSPEQPHGFEPPASSETPDASGDRETPPAAADTEGSGTPPGAWIGAAPPAQAAPEPPVAPPAPEPPSDQSLTSDVEPGIAATLEVPALEGEADSGGEFELLLQKIRDWFGSGELQAQWQRIQGPLKGLAILVGLLLALRVYGSLIHTLESLPLVGGLLELVGLIAVTRFSATKLVRRSDREQVVADWSRRWNDFRGKG